MMFATHSRQSLRHVYDTVCDKLTTELASSGSAEDNELQQLRNGNARLKALLTEHGIQSEEPAPCFHNRHGRSLPPSVPGPCRCLSAQIRQFLALSQHLLNLDEYLVLAHAAFLVEPRGIGEAGGVYSQANALFSLPVQDGEASP